MKAIFKNLCPNCGGDISSERFEKALPCEKCLLNEGKLGEIISLKEEIRAWEEHFEKGIGFKPWGLQITWAKRVLRGVSFALLAPTGIGKTSFGISMAAFLAKKGKKSYIVAPTKLLVEQIFERTKNFDISEEKILFFGDETGKSKREKLEKLKNGNFNILITTSMFLYKNYQFIPKNFDFIFVDDVDSFLKTAKNVDKCLILLGFDEDDIKNAFELIKIKGEKEKSDEDWQKIEIISNKLKEKKEKVKGVFVVSSATSNPKSNRVKLFRELLGFEVGVPTFYLRNVVDVYTEENLLIEYIKKLGKGGLLFLSSEKGRESIREIRELLLKENINVVSYEEIDDEKIREFREGRIDLFVGISSFRNPLARGLDLPDAVRYAIFYGVPKIQISLKFEQNLSHLFWALSSIRAQIVKKYPEYDAKITNYLNQLKKYQHLSEEFINQRENLKNKIDLLRKEIGKFFSEDKILDLLKNSEELTLKYIDGEYVLSISDVTGYLQASGRTSRMFAGGITKGLSLIIVDDKSVFLHLRKRTKWLFEDIEFVNIREVNLNSILEEIDNDRKKLKEFFERKIPVATKSPLKVVLVIVESPNKARTIANFFGKPIRRRVGEHEVYEICIEDRYLMITSSFGHILDLTTKEGFHGVFVNGEVIPVYEPIEGKEDIIEVLRKSAFEVEQVLVATDPDTEGEKIGWDIKEILKPYIDDIRRMEFHEVTKKAIVNSIKNPRDFNLDLVKAQILRRIADRWIGFEFSHLLFKVFSNLNLSAGRVQTPVLGWIIEREKEYFKKIYKVFVTVRKNGKRIRLSFEFEKPYEAYKFIKEAEEIEIKKIGEKEEIIHPLPPYRTDTMLKDASDFYKFSLPFTMELAQNLFELGYITYHRTDSLRVSDTGISLAYEFIKEEFGSEYFQKRIWGEGGAHECIRPTRIIEPEELYSMLYSGQIEGLRKEHLLLYTMIFNRFIGSQMRSVKVKIEDYIIRIYGKEEKISLITQIIEDGFNKISHIEVYPSMEGIYGSGDFEKKIVKLPKANRYTQGELVFKMKERGIGRPSTYATIIEKLLERKYVIEEKGYLVPTELGWQVYMFLQKRKEIQEFLKEEFTRKLEELMDMVENGKMDYNIILKELLQQILKARKKGILPVQSAYNKDLKFKDI
ncbi:MAG: reverse gyrase [Candidatus Omnitrophica bacterium]|nr:reverse gyrase [Candidatus Omnitrophota bacterium]